MGKCANDQKKYQERNAGDIPHTILLRRGQMPNLDRLFRGLVIPVKEYYPWELARIQREYGPLCERAREAIADLGKLGIAHALEVGVDTLKTTPLRVIAYPTDDKLRTRRDLTWAIEPSFLDYLAEMQKRGIGKGDASFLDLGGDYNLGRAARICLDNAVVGRLEFPERYTLLAGFAFLLARNSAGR